jgi:hypothetical protein
MQFPGVLCDPVDFFRAHLLEQGKIGQYCVNLGAAQIISSQGRSELLRVKQQKILPIYIPECNFMRC